MLGKVTDLPAVRTAAIASQLSRLVYHEVVQGQQYDFSIPEDADGHALARFVCKAETAACKPHYVVFVVPGTAIFLAYRGTTASFFDACVDITFMPTPLVGTKYLQVGIQDLPGTCVTCMHCLKQAPGSCLALVSP